MHAQLGSKTSRKWLHLLGWSVLGLGLISCAPMVLHHVDQLPAGIKPAVLDFEEGVFILGIDGAAVAYVRGPMRSRRIKTTAVGVALSPGDHELMFVDPLCGTNRRRDYYSHVIRIQLEADCHYKVSVTLNGYHDNLPTRTLPFHTYEYNYWYDSWEIQIENKRDRKLVFKETVKYE